MNKLYLILLPTELDRNEVIQHLNQTGSITFWFYSFPYSIFVRSNFSARQLQNTIASRFSPNRIFITQITSTTDISGLVPNEHVELFNNL